MSEDFEIRVKKLLDAKFKKGTTIIDVCPGFGDNLHLMVVSKKFNKKSESYCVDMIWDFLDEFVKEKKITKKELSRISLLLTYSTQELKAKLKNV